MTVRHAPGRRWRIALGTAVVVLLVATGSGAALAQSAAPAASEPGPGQAPPATTPPATPPAPPASKPAAPAVGTPATVVDDQQIESVLGKSVQSPKGDDMGHIVDILIDHTGDVRAAVIDFGGFFGVGSRKIAVDWRSLHFKGEGKSDAIVADLSPEKLRTAPVYKDGEPVVIIGGPAPAPPNTVPPAAPAPKTPTPPEPPAQ